MGRLCEPSSVPIGKLNFECDNPAEFVLVVMTSERVYEGEEWSLDKSRPYIYNHCAICAALIKADFACYNVSPKWYFFKEM